MRTSSLSLSMCACACECAPDQHPFLVQIWGTDKGMMCLYTQTHIHNLIQYITEFPLQMILPQTVTNTNKEQIIIQAVLQPKLQWFSASLIPAD